MRWRRSHERGERGENIVYRCTERERERERDRERGEGVDAIEAQSGERASLTKNICTTTVQYVFIKGLLSFHIVREKKKIYGLYLAS